MLRTFLKFAVFGSLALLLTSLWLSEALPPPAELDAALLREPVQRLANERAFDTTVGGITYTVKPLYRYEITGLVVSRHDAGGWRDVLHKDWNDKLNVADVCVVWGHNANTGIYRNLSFWNGQFTCNWEAPSMEAYEGFDETAISNNHLLTANTHTARRIREARVGDQIRMTGMLAEYSHNHGFPFKRGTSITRSDSGNGACETIYVEDFSILRTGGGPWRSLRWLAGVLLSLSLLGWFFQPPKFDHT
ncbi:MAG: hypothetical protein QM776_07200 [Rhodocyclaceae bacterium]